MIASRSFCFFRVVLPRLLTRPRSLRGSPCPRHSRPTDPRAPDPTSPHSSGFRLEEDDAPIKRCPKCKVYIERDEGCAQMMCKNCKHAFCWYCLESLDVSTGRPPARPGRGRAPFAEEPTGGSGTPSLSGPLCGTHKGVQLCTLLNPRSFEEMVTA